MTYPLPPPSSLSAQSSSSGQANPASSTQPASAQQHSAAGGSDSSLLTRQRALSPISTTQSSLPRHPSLSHTTSSPPTASSPFTSSFSSILNSSARPSSGRANTPQSAIASAGQAGSQTDNPLSSPRSKHQNQPSYSQAFTGASTTSSQAPASGPGGGSTAAASAHSASGGAGRNSISFSPNITSPTSNSFGSSNLPSSSGGSSGQFSKIIAAQVLILLSTMKADDPVKQAAMADQIKKLVDNSDDLEVWGKYFRKLIMANAQVIFPNHSKSVEKAANYSMLEKEMQLITRSPNQAMKIALSISGGSEEIFRDFNLVAFLDHFKLDAVERFVLCVAVKETSRSDLQNKAESIYLNNYLQFCEILGYPNSEKGQTYIDLPPSFIGHIIYRLTQLSFQSFREKIDQDLRVPMARRYSFSDSEIPTPISIPLTLFYLVDKFEKGGDDPLVWHISQIGPSLTESAEHCKELLRPVDQYLSSPEQVASALIYMAAHEYYQEFRPDVFVKVVRNRVKNWQQVIRGFDQEFIALDSSRFLFLYKALYPLAADNIDIDIQGMWGGEWASKKSQAYFLAAFMGLNSSQMESLSVPRLRLAFDESDFEDASPAVQEYGKAAMTTPFASLDAITALFYVAFQSQDSLVASPYDRYLLHEVIKPKIDIFICSALRVEKPKTATQNELIIRAFASILIDKQPQHDFLLHVLWKRHRQWVAQRMFQVHSDDPMTLPRLLQICQEQKWLDDLVVVLNGFGLDLTALAHKRGLLDLEKWAEAESQRTHPDLSFALIRFLNIKADDELQGSRTDSQGLRTVPLAIKTVNGLLETLDEISDPRHTELIGVQRHCITAYPRLINFGEGFDDIIEANGELSNALPSTADEKMQEYYKKMYGAEVEVRDIVQTLRGFKQSRNPADQDLFACMIHGLFEEYICFHEYPLEALATTAVLFGGLVNFGLINGIPLRVALGMILEAVRDFGPETSMYKFGLQALTNFKSRLGEWAGFCNLLLQVSGLRGTEPYTIAEQVVRERANEDAQDNLGNAEGSNGVTNQASTVTNGNVDEAFPVEPALKPFSCIHLSSQRHADIFENPSEDVQDKVLFVLNNISERNFDSKVAELLEHLREPHYQWFAHYLVEERARMQPNFQKLYLNMLERIPDKLLDAEILRESYNSIIKLLNSQTIMQSVQERGHLKNLGGWLGSLTLAKERMLLHRNIPLPDLLVEAYDSKRLLAVIPFVCKVMAQGVDTKIFKPTNAWVTIVIRLLIELYHHGDLKLNAKFEIEVLCKAYGLDHTTVEAATTIRDRPRGDELMGTAIQGAFEASLEDSAIGFPRSAARTERFNPEAIIASMPDMGSRLVFPPTHASGQSRLRQIVQAAFQRAAGEIVTPVVERSVTIAALSTQQLIQKDFATEISADSLRGAAVNMVKALAGSLALVTCKEPLRVSVTNYIRMMSQELGDQAPAEGVILMCVNDNLDMVCGMVETAAEERAIPEIEEHITPFVRARQQHIASQRNGEPFIDPVWNRWSTYIPEPYKPSANGLNKQQMAIYDEFNRYPKGALGHNNGQSIDSGRSITADTAPEQLPPMPNLSTPAEQPLIPRQTGPPQAQRALPPTQTSQAQVNGFADPKTIADRLHLSLLELIEAAKDSPVQRMRDSPLQSPLQQALDRVMGLLGEAGNREEFMLNTARWISSNLYQPVKKPIEVEVLVLLLRRVCQRSPSTSKEVLMWLASQPEEQLFNTNATLALLDAGMMELYRADQAITKAVTQPNNQPNQPINAELQAAAIEFLEQLMNELLFGSQSLGFRADFAGSVEALHGLLHNEAGDLDRDVVEKARLLLTRLKEVDVKPPMPDVAGDPELHHRAQMEYVFIEWTRLCNLDVSEKSSAAFIFQLCEKYDMSIAKDGGIFLRLCMDLSLVFFEKQLLGGNASRGDAYSHMDAVAKLVVYLAKYQSVSDEVSENFKGESLESLLSLVVLVFMFYHERTEQSSYNMMFRFFSSLLFEVRSANLSMTGFKTPAVLTIGEALLKLQPKYCPGYSFQWLSVVGHRVFMPATLIHSEIDGWKVYAQLVESLLEYVGKTLSAPIIAPAAKDFYRGVLRLLLILHHDFPEFLAENHLQFCSVIPAHCTQLRNLVLSAYPSSFPELPDPFTAGLKVDRISEIRSPPAIASDVEKPLHDAGVKDLIEDCMVEEASDDKIDAVCSALASIPGERKDEDFSGTMTFKTLVLNAMVLHVGNAAISTNQQLGGPTFVPTSHHAVFTSRIVHNLDFETRYYFLSAIANQLRYPNSHTHYFSYSLLMLFGNDLTDETELEIKQQITRVLLERLIVHRPHPWGLIITLLELLKNPDYGFWDLPFIKAAPEIERLFAALVQHVNSGGR